MTSDASEPRGRGTNSEILRRWARRVFPWALLVASAWLILDSMHMAAPIETGTAAPALVATVEDGSRFDLEEHRGEVVVVNFWASWCPPCRAEAPALSAVHESLGAGGSVIGISMDRGDMADIARAADRLGMRYPIAQTDQAAIDRFQVTQLPTTYVVAPDGDIVWSRVGEATEAELRAAIDRARAHR